MPTRYQTYKTKIASVLNLTQEQAKELEPQINALFARGHTLVAAVAYLRHKLKSQAAADTLVPHA
jgi:hypothetical protein